MVHYYNHIKNFGSPNGLCSSITESKHIAAVKRPWRWTNRNMPLPQILKINERLDKISTARVDFTTCGMLTDLCLDQATMDLTDSDAADSDVTSSDDDLDSDTSSNDNPNNNTSSDNDPDDDALNDGALSDNGLDNNNDFLDASSPPPPVGDGDDKCGPVESGPLMNEVHLVGRKGK